MKERKKKGTHSNFLGSEISFKSFIRPRMIAINEKDEREGREKEERRKREKNRMRPEGREESILMRIRKEESARKSRKMGESL